MQHLKEWLDRDSEPRDFYELLGMPCLSRQRDELIKASRGAYQFLQHHQNHPNPDHVRRACQLQRMSADANHVFSDDAAWTRYDQQVLQRLSMDCRQQFAVIESPAGLRKWLKEAQRVAQERLEEIERILKDDAAKNSIHGPVATATAQPAATVTRPTGPAASSSLVARSLPFQMGSYEVLERLGEGGIGVVFKVRHLSLQKLFALKILHPERAPDHQTISRFHREMRAIGQLAHPHIVGATDAGEFEGTPFLVMELIQGKTLYAQIRERGPAAIPEACEWIRQTALGLQHAHERGLIHRDIKPSNLMLTADEKTVKILDLGLARLNRELFGDEPSEASSAVGDGQRSVLTASGMILGTVDYMAPEQVCKSAEVDQRSDIYSLGCTLFFLLAGRAPFYERDASLFERAMAKNTRPTPKISAERGDIPARLDQLLLKMMAKSPQDRFATAGAVAEALADLSRRPVHLPPMSRPVSLVPTPEVGAPPPTPRGGARVVPPPPSNVKSVTKSGPQPAAVPKNSSFAAAPPAIAGERNVPPPIPAAKPNLSGSMPVATIIPVAPPPARREPTAQQIGTATIALWCLTGLFLLMTAILGVLLMLNIFRR